MEYYKTDPVQLTLRVIGFMSEWRIYANDTKTKCPGSMFMHKADKEYYVKRLREYDRIVMRLHQGVDDISERNTLSNKKQTIYNNFEDLYCKIHHISRGCDPKPIKMLK